MAAIISVRPPFTLEEIMGSQPILQIAPKRVRYFSTLKGVNFEEKRPYIFRNRFYSVIYLYEDGLEYVVLRARDGGYKLVSINRGI